jgi:periplasmic protein TonB
MGQLRWVNDYLREDSLKEKLDSSIKHLEIESAFQGGLPGWITYLTKNLVYPERAMNRNVQGRAAIMFVVDKDGTVYDAVIKNSVEYSIDQEALRLIKKSPRWTPASKDGIKLKSYKIQPLTFRLTN